MFSWPEHRSQAWQERKCGLRVLTFTDGDEIAEKYTGEYDIILMDIQMRFMDGMTAAEKIRKVDSDVIIMFLTNRTDYAIRGYQVDALDYVVKPVSYFSFAQKLDRALERVSNRQKSVVVLQTRSGVVKLDPADIYYVESDRHNEQRESCRLCKPLRTGRSRRGRGCFDRQRRWYRDSTALYFQEERS
ncbi:MAG: response regulator [Lachnospiraceae bacterium]|nr:response regulator [Lachnospiraceae bacterium]